MDKKNAVNAGPIRIGIAYPAKSFAHFLCAAQKMSESQILGALCCRRAAQAYQLTYCNMCIFCTAAAWHEV
jgi:hypothetical protein